MVVLLCRDLAPMMLTLRNDVPVVGITSTYWSEVSNLGVSNLHKDYLQEGWPDSIDTLLLSLSRKSKLRAKSMDHLGRNTRVSQCYTSPD